MPSYKIRYLTQHWFQRQQFTHVVGVSQYIIVITPSTHRRPFLIKHYPSTWSPFLFVYTPATPIKIALPYLSTDVGAMCIWLLNFLYSDGLMLNLYHWLGLIVSEDLFPRCNNAPPQYMPFIREW